MVYTTRFVLSNVMKLSVTGINGRKKKCNDVPTERTFHFEVVIYMTVFVELSRQWVALSGKRKPALIAGAQSTPCYLRNFDALACSRITYGVH